MLEYNQLAGFNSVSPEETDYFKTTWTTTVINTVIEIGFGTSNEYAFIDWGDGNTETTRASGAAVTHNYVATGSYTVKIIGAVHITTDYSANNDMASAICTGVTQMGVGVSYRSMKNMFKTTPTLAFSFTDTPDTSLVTDMSGVFNDAALFNQDVSGWDVSSVTTMLNMFNGATVFNQNISSWNVANVTSMVSMFSNADAFNQDISPWTTTKVTTMQSMFEGCALFNNGGVALDWASTPALTNCQYMFKQAVAFNQPITFSTTTVTNMYEMFGGANAFNQDISDWDVSSVTQMSLMFYLNTGFNNGGVALDWADTGSLLSIQSMFNGATTFNQSVSSWDTSLVTNMDRSFNGATAFNQDISSWNVQLVTNMSNILSGTATSTANYNLMWIAWDALTTLVSSVPFGATGIAATGTGLTARNNIVTNYSWTITDAS